MPPLTNLNTGEFENPANYDDETVPLQPASEIINRGYNNVIQWERGDVDKFIETLEEEHSLIYSVCIALRDLTPSSMYFIERYRGLKKIDRTKLHRLVMESIGDCPNCEKLLEFIDRSWRNYDQLNVEVEA